MHSLARSAALNVTHQLLMRGAICGCPFRLCSSSLPVRRQTRSNPVATYSMSRGVWTSKMVRQSGPNTRMNQKLYLKIDFNEQQQVPFTASLHMTASPNLASIALSLLSHRQGLWLNLPYWHAWVQVHTEHWAKASEVELALGISVPGSWSQGIVLNQMLLKTLSDQSCLVRFIHCHQHFSQLHVHPWTYFGQLIRQQP